MSKRGADPVTTKLASLSHAFLTKAAELVYDMRAPNELPDFIEDKTPELGLIHKKSPSLRQNLTSKLFYGWFQVDVLLSEPETPIESWYMIHLPLKPDQSNDGRNRDDLKKEVFTKMKASLRSIYVLLNALPAESLIRNMKNMPNNNRKIYIKCSQFQQLPAHHQDFVGFESAKERFGPIVSPVGRAVIFCTYRTDLYKEIPRPMRVFHRTEQTVEQEIPRPAPVVYSEPQGFGRSYEDTGSLLRNLTFTNSPTLSILSGPDEFVDSSPSIASSIVTPFLDTEAFTDYIKATQEEGFPDTVILPDLFSRLDAASVRLDNLL